MVCYLFVSVLVFAGLKSPLLSIAAQQAAVPSNLIGLGYLAAKLNTTQRQHQHAGTVTWTWVFARVKPDVTPVIQPEWLAGSELKLAVMCYKITDQWFKNKLVAGARDILSPMQRRLLFTELGKPTPKHNPRAYTAAYVLSKTKQLQQLSVVNHILEGVDEDTAVRSMLAQTFLHLYPNACAASIGKIINETANYTTSSDYVRHDARIDSKTLVVTPAVPVVADIVTLTRTYFIANFAANKERLEEEDWLGVNLNELSAPANVSKLSWFYLNLLSLIYGAEDAATHDKSLTRLLLQYVRPNVMLYSDTILANDLDTEVANETDKLAALYINPDNETAKLIVEYETQRDNILNNLSPEDAEYNLDIIQTTLSANLALVHARIKNKVIYNFKQWWGPLSAAVKAVFINRIKANQAEVEASFLPLLARVNERLQACYPYKSLEELSAHLGAAVNHAQYTAANVNSPVDNTYYYMYNALSFDRDSFITNAQEVIGNVFNYLDAYVGALQPVNIAKQKIKDYTKELTVIKTKIQEQEKIINRLTKHGAAYTVMVPQYNLQGSVSQMWRLYYHARGMVN